MARAAKSGNDEVARVIQRADIEIVAKSLGIQVDNRGRQPLRAICPFHDDSDPSLNLYKGGAAAGERDHYHCFVCSAHGDVVSLVQNFERIGFWEAVQRLASIQGVEIASSRRAPVDRRSGSAIVSELIENAPVDDASLIAFAADRGFDADFIKRSHAAVVDLREISRQAQADRTIEERLVEAGILRRGERKGNEPELYGPSLKSFFGGRRLVFKITDVHGETAGFAARATGGDVPKYLFSYDFPRRNTLYGLDSVAHHVRSTATDASAGPIEIYLVEGIFDVLRLRSFGLLAAGVLGSRITSGQLANLSGVIQSARDNGRQVVLRLLFDRDAAGRRGTYDAAISLLTLLGQTHPFDLEVIWPAGDGEAKIDPDSWLKGLDRTQALQTLAAARLPALTFLAAFRLGADPHAIEWEKYGRLKIAAEARAVALSIPGAVWSNILAPLDTGSAGDGLAEFSALVRGYGGHAIVPGQSAELLKRFRDPADDRADLLSALTLGRSSTSRREYPLDDYAWERLTVAASPLFHIHRARLEIGDGPSAPLLSRSLPKGDDRYRLKSGPVAEDALLQQYVMLELLMDRLDCQSFAEMIPAVRYAPERGAAKALYRTGSTGERTSLSFAYQIDMDIVNGECPPRREGIFRPYFECWRSFVDFLDDRIKRFEHEDLQILRLDITGFYDNVRRDVVSGALVGPLEHALNLLPAADDDTHGFAPMLRPDAGHSAASRAEAVTGFLLNHSFGLSYLDPETGKSKIHDQRLGIPQGPDLSAYLANIALFDLDDMMEAEIDQLARVDRGSTSDDASPRCAAAYARYVDDVVLICRDLETANALRRKVEAWLALKGLTLNRKNVTPPPMTRAEARAWLTDNRAGFGFSGPLADLPNTDAMDPLADAGEIDRKTALGLLFDPELDDPANADASLVRLGMALSAPDIRFNDRASAYRRLWCLAANRPDVDDGQSLADAFWSMLLQAEPQTALLAGSEKALDIGLACLEGLDRALRSSTHMNTLAEEASEQVAAILLRLSANILDDVFTPLARHVLGGPKIALLLNRFDIRCQTAIIACLAAQRLLDKAKPFGFARVSPHFSETWSGEGRQPLPEGLRLSLVKFDPAFAPAAPPSILQGQSKTDAAFANLNRTIVALQRIASHGADEEPIPYDAAVAEELSPIASLTSLIMRVWTPSDTGSHVSHSAQAIELDAAATLVNITYANFADVAARRPRLMHLIANTSNAVPLPSPPGLETSGIMLWCDENRLLLATAEGADAAPVGTNWTDASTQSVPGIRLRVSDLPGDYAPLFLMKREWTPGAIATVYRAGFPAFAESLLTVDGRVPVPTAFSFFVRMASEAEDLTAIKLISWDASRDSVDSLAFVRAGTSLGAKKVFFDGADYWRYGWAVRDVCERANLATDEEPGIDADALTKLHRDIQRREAIVVRVLPKLSGADRWGAGDVTAEKPIPTRVERALSLLEHFDASQSPASHAAYLVAAMAEGMYMSERINSDVNLGTPGQPAALMVRSSRRLTRSLPEAVKLWPGTIDAPLPYRRSAAAWQTISVKIADHIPGVARSAVPPLVNLSLGVGILAAVADIRALAFELTSGLPREAIEQLEQCGLEPSWLSDLVGLDVILVDADGSEVDLSLDGQARTLLKTFSQIVLGRKGGLGALRDRIAPTGWAVLVAILLQVAPLRQSRERLRPRLWPMDATRLAQAETALCELIGFFASTCETPETDEEWPWGAFQELGRNKPSDLAAVLRTLTECARLDVTNEESWSNPRTGESQSDRAVMRLADGSSQSLADWQVDIAHSRGERGTATEAHSVGSRMRFRYSVSRREDQVLGMHLISRQLADAVFGEHGEIPNTAATSPTAIHGADPFDAGPRGSSSNLERTETPAIEIGGEPRADTETDAAGSTPAPTPASEQPTDADDLGIPPLETLRRIQRSSWTARGKDKSLTARRLAIVQWDVAETYSSPGDGDGKLEGLLAPASSIVAANGRIKKGGVFVSTTEFRRRAILKEVLEACKQFKVEGIVLPEYSVRPETVNWLARRIRAMALPVTIWSGTFRVPSGTQLDRNYLPNALVPFVTADLAAAPAGRDRWEAHTALLSCLRTVESKDGQGIDSAHFVRQKRYPSAAAGELIRPPLNMSWSPQLDNVTDPFDIGTFTLELICSEMFPHASSANFVGVIEENHELARRYQLPNSSLAPFEYLSNDIYEFARWTAYRNPLTVVGDPHDKLARGKKLQRTLVVLPAMTARSADYHIFGQNQYLATGLVTAFCNAVSPPYGCGQSAFVGLDGWKITEAIRTPYGSKSPGVFQLGSSKHSGPLGKSESAVVIADLDLLRTTEQKPTPHYQTKALKLVAHLPMIFATERGRGGEAAGDYPHRDRRVRKKAVNGVEKIFEEAAYVFLAALQAEGSWRSVGNVANPATSPSANYIGAIDATRNALLLLEQFVDDPSWMVKRTASFADERYKFPPVSPLPVLVDWIYVDDRWQPDPRMLAQPAGEEDALTSDRPVLAVPASMEDDPRREAG